jgi:hypothetical protein
MEQNTSIQDTSVQNANNEAEKNLEAAKAEIEIVLKKYKVALIPVIIHHGDTTFSRIDITNVQEKSETVQA